MNEKEINQDYYLKRAIIFSLITAIGTPCAQFIGGFIGSLANKNVNATKSVDKLGNKILAWFFGNAISLVIWLIFVGLTIYYAVKSWKAYKACQELANPTLSTETEREREINLGVSSQWAETLVY